MANLSSFFPEGGGAVDWQTTAKTANFTATAGEGYLVDTSSAAITVTLPSSPSAGDTVNIMDYGANAATNNITITSSDDIEDSSSNKVINYDKGAIELVYSGSTKGWLVASAANETDTALRNPSFTVEYLVVAGGGGGGSGTNAVADGGGGGAGGLRTSYGTTSGGGAAAETDLTLEVGVDYTISVGTGGAAQTNGGNSFISGTGITTITSLGGGGGGGTSATDNGHDGGSGGGGSPSGASTNGSGTSGQGYDADHGGGGAGAAGSEGEGGAGLAVNILNSTNAGTASVGEVSGSDVYYAGGGGAGGLSPHDGGIGGGGDGEPSQGTDATAGDSNTGGGGGGREDDYSATGKAGGSGVVILRYPSAYTITKGSSLTEASGSPFTEGSDKVSVFTGGEDTISFG